MSKTIRNRSRGLSRFSWPRGRDREERACFAAKMGLSPSALTFCLAAAVFLGVTAGRRACLAQAQESPPSAAKPAPEKPAQPAAKRIAITISKETTYITGPLRADGYVDYVAALNQRCSLGVTPENNAAVLFWQAVGPSAINAEQRERFFKMLGIPVLPEKGDYFVKLDDYVSPLGDNTDSAEVEPEAVHRDRVRKQLDQAIKRPWSPSEFPILAGWLSANEKPLALLIEASKRPKRYDPLVGASSGEEGMVFAVLLPGLQEMREVAKALNARAMLRVEQSDTDAAWDDLLACHRFARLASQGATMVDSVAAITIDGTTCESDQALIRCGRLSAAQAIKMKGSLERLSDMAEVADVINAGERFVYLDCVGVTAREGPSVIYRLIDTWVQGNEFPQPILNAVVRAVTNWDVPLRMGNLWYDRLANAYRKPASPRRWAELCKARDDLDKEIRKAKDWQRLALSALANPRQAHSELVGWGLLSMFVPAITVLADLEDRTTTRFDLTRLAFALAAYRADQGAYPEKLGDLSPKYIAQVPPDIFSGGQLRYRHEGEGYLLYSVGFNGKDDGGKSADDRTQGEDWDDLVVRMTAMKPPVAKATP